MIKKRRRLRKKRLRKNRRRKRKFRKMARKFWKEDNEAIPAIKFELTQPIGFTEITDGQEIKELYKIQYSYRISDGKNYVLDFTTDKYIDVLNEIYTEAEVFALENHIKDLYDQLNNGWWLTAQNTNSSLSLSGIYTQVMKDQIQLDLDTYITNNY